MSSEAPRPRVVPVLSLTLYARAAIPRSLILACNNGETKFLGCEECFNLTHLGKRAGIELVLGGDLQTDVAACGGVPCGFGTGLNFRIDFVVVTGGKDAQIVGGGDGCGIGWLTVACGKSILGDGSLSNIISSFCADQETFMAESSVKSCDWALEEIGEETSVNVRLLVVEVKLAAVGLLDWEVVGEDFGFETLREVILKLNFGVEAVGGRPRLS